MNIWQARVKGTRVKKYLKPYSILLFKYDYYSVYYLSNIYHNYDTFIKGVNKYLNKRKIGLYDKNGIGIVLYLENAELFIIYSKKIILYIFIYFNFAMIKVKMQKILDRK